MSGRTPPPRPSTASPPAGWRAAAESRKSRRNGPPARQRRTGSGSDADALDQVAACAHRLAVMLDAGVPAGAAWWHVLPERFPTPPASSHCEGQGLLPAEVLAQLAQRSHRARPAVASAWRCLGAGWEIAVASGAPTAAALRRFAHVFEQRAGFHRDFTAALAGPRATVRLVIALPVVGIAFGVLLGIDTLGTLVATIPGALCLAGGALLLLLGRRWSRVLLLRASAGLRHRGTTADLLAVALSGGRSLDGAEELVRAAGRSWGSSPDPAERAAIDDVLRLARTTGVPAAALLRGEADALRRRDRADGQRIAAELGVRLMLPLAVCVLPAFLLLAVVPVLLSVLGSTLQGLQQ